MSRTCWGSPGPDTLAELFQSGRIIDLILMLVALEVCALPWLLRRRGTALRTRDLLPNITAGIALMLAVRLSLTGENWQWIAAALGAHLLDLWMRLALNQR